MSIQKRIVMVFRSLITSVLMVIAGLAVAQLLVLMQRPSPIGQSGLPPSTLPPPIAATGQVYSATHDAQYRDRTPGDFHIAYLIAEGAAAPESLISEQTFARFFGAQPIHSWDAFAAQNAQQPYQIILIHDSLYEQIDKTWTQWAYRNRVLLIGISMPFEHLVEITGDRCQENVNRRMFEEYEHLYLIFAYNVELEDESYHERIDEQYLELCTQNPDLEGSPAHVYQTLGNAPITQIESLNSLRNHLMISAVEYKLIAPLLPPAATPRP